MHTAAALSSYNANDGPPKLKSKEKTREDDYDAIEVS
jgi:hypothetical protein